MKAFINHILGRFGYHITKKYDTYHLATMLKRIAQRTPIDIQTVIDVGASDGRWSEIVMPFYPHAKYLLVEANPYHQEKLKAFKSAHPTSDFVLAVAGDKLGEIYFDAHDPFGGATSHTPKAGYITLPATTLDHEVRQRHLTAPYLIKLDVHGFEVPILRGASDILHHTNMLIIEAYNFTLETGALRFHELCAYLENQAFARWIFASHCIGQMGYSGNSICALSAKIAQNLLITAITWDRKGYPLWMRCNANVSALFKHVMVTCYWKKRMSSV